MTWQAVSLTDLAGVEGCPIGGKAAGVVALLAAGLTVPDGFVVCPVVSPGVDVGHPPSVGDAVADGYAALARRCGVPDPLVAVRSTSAIEDGEHHSAAGLLPTELGVRGGAVAEAVARVSSAGVGLVREYSGALVASPGPQPVLVQVMVSPRLAGVSFSAHPVTGARDRVLVEAVRGLGVLLTDGRVVPESATLERASGRVVAQRAGRQKVAARLTATGGVGMVELPTERLAIPSLDSVALEAIWTATVAAERVLGVPADVEWAIDDDARLWLLQARPITTLPD